MSQFQAFWGKRSESFLFSSSEARGGWQFCTCEPFVLGSQTSNGADPARRCWDLGPFSGAFPELAQAANDAIICTVWRIIELSTCYPEQSPWYGFGRVNGEGYLVGLPAEFCSTFAYDGYLELQIGCYDMSTGLYTWPGTCQPITT